MQDEHMFEYKLEDSNSFNNKTQMFKYPTQTQSDALR